MSVAQEIGRWSFLEKLGSQVQSKGRQNLNVMPPVDAAALRAGVADGSIKPPSPVSAHAPWTGQQQHTSRTVQKFSTLLRAQQQCN